MSNNLIVKKHQLLDKQFNLVYIYNNKQAAFSYGKNPLNGGWMYWFTGKASNSMYAAKNLSEIKQIVKRIKSKFDIVSEVTK